MLQLRQRTGRDLQASWRVTGGHESRRSRGRERAVVPCAAAPPSTEFRGPGEPAVALGVLHRQRVQRQGAGRPGLLDQQRDPLSISTSSTAAANQQWNLVPLADGNDLIVNAYSGKVLDDPAFSTSNGTLIDQYQLNGGLNQQWMIVTLSNGYAEIDQRV